MGSSAQPRPGAASPADPVALVSSVAPGSAPGGPPATAARAYAPGPAAGIRVSGVSLTFRGARTTEALADIDLEVRPREVVALIGPNGCGKSTLLRAIAGLVPVTAGEVAVDGIPVTGPDPRVGLVFQESRLLPWRTTEGNVRFPMDLAGWPRDRQEARASELLGLVGLREFAGARPSTLSGGTRQRVSIARALALEPGVLLLDEPFSALDALTRERFNAELLNLWARTGTTIVIVTHSIPEAVFLADRVVVLSPRPGRVVAEIPVDLPRPRRAADLDSAFVSSIASDVRRHLVDTTDDAIVLAEARTALLAAGRARAATGHPDTHAGTPAWFDPFRQDDES